VSIMHLSTQSWFAFLIQHTVPFGFTSRAMFGDPFPLICKQGTLSGCLCIGCILDFRIHCGRSLTKGIHHTTTILRTIPYSGQNVQTFQAH
jgi:hypothetical protein